LSSATRATSSCNNGSPPGADDEALAIASPSARDSFGQLRGARKAPAARAIGADEIGIAEAASRRGTIFFAAGPEIAAGKAAENGGTPSLPPLALQRVENFFDGIGHEGVLAARRA
jgi:hypothetical protein